jgi:hypothetical protein
MAGEAKNLGRRARRQRWRAPLSGLTLVPAPLAGKQPRKYAMHSQSERFLAAIDRFDAANREDPNHEVYQGQDYPRELLYAQRMSRCVERLAPDASEAVRLAARSQHIRRWEIPRGQYALDRRGYHRWRTTLYGFHAAVAGRILHEVGYDDATVRRVEDLLSKKGLKTDPEMQLLEDVICLVFLEYYVSGFARQKDEAAMITIVRKTWQKMSERGQQAALELPLSPADRALIEKALGQ